MTANELTIDSLIAAANAFLAANKVDVVLRTRPRTQAYRFALQLMRGFDAADHELIMKCIVGLGGYSTVHKAMDECMDMFFKNDPLVGEIRAYIRDQRPTQFTTDDFTIARIVNDSVKLGEIYELGAKKDTEQQIARLYASLCIPQSKIIADMTKD